MSLLVDTETNRFWARVDFLATGEIALHIPEECELPIRVLVSRGGRSTEYEPSNSEIPNNCDTCRNKGVEGCEQPCLGCGCCGLYEPKDEPTISKMEQVDEPTTQTETQNSNLTFEKRTMRDCYNCKRYETKDECIECHYEPKDLEQFRVGLEYHTDTTHFGKVKGESITTNKVEDEPQTERSE